MKRTRFELESVGDGFTWRRQNRSVDIDVIDDQMRTITADGQHLRSIVFVKVSDAHREAEACYLCFDVFSSRGACAP